MEGEIINSSNIEEEEPCQLCEVCGKSRGTGKEKLNKENWDQHKNSLKQKTY